MNTAARNKIARHLACRLFSCIFLLLAACAAPGPDTSIPLRDGDCAACTRAFPQGDWQFVHEIIFRFPAGRGHFLGIVSTDGQELRCALTTLEGLTVFAARTPTEARPGDPVQVERALPPLDKPGFAAGLIADLRLLFTAPAGVPRCGGRAGEKLCRWQNDDVVTDITIKQDGCWVMRAFHDGRLTRTAQASHCVARDGYVVPAGISLRATGDADYELTMRLISAENTGK